MQFIKAIMTKRIVIIAFDLEIGESSDPNPRQDRYSLLGASRLPVRRGLSFRFY